MFNPRPKQQKVIDFTQGRMGVAAVPGSGKTQTLSFLAARLIHEGYIEEGQEILVVTLTNSAVGNFQSRIDGFIHQYGMIKGIGYRVRTLHGLAHDIVRERPDLVGLPTQFNIIDDREAHLMLENSVRDWLLANPELENLYFEPDNRIKNQKKWVDTIVDCCGAFIRTAKDLQMDSFELSAHLSALDVESILLRMGCEVYADYTRKLSLREGVDFDDLIRYALRALNTDPDFLKRLRHRWPYVLEDEAQDSSHLQEEILELLTAEGGSWVRVGDPNQAIFETFTTADPKLLRNFIERDDVEEAQLTNAGRSSQKIIDLANHLVNWTVNEHPVKELRDALYEAYIEETPPGDPQPNPSDEESTIRIYPPSKRISSERETQIVIRFLQNWLEQEHHNEETVAILVPTNYLGEKVIEALKEAQIPYVELLRNTANTRRTAQQLEAIIYALAHPTDIRYLQKAYETIRQPKEIVEEELRFIAEETSRQLRTCRFVEEYLYPLGGTDWLESIANDIEAAVYEQLEWLRTLFRRWQAAVMLPIDQLILTIAADLYQEPADLALSHKFAQMLEFFARSHQAWSLDEFAAELNEISTSQRKFSGLSVEDTGFDPDSHRGKVVVSTMHKAKGLEWDIVYLMSVSNYDFPSLDPFDQYYAEKFFIRDNLNLQEETLAQLKALISNDRDQLWLPEGEATINAREGIAEERLRLLYVGITRARKELIMLYNIGTFKKNVPAKAYLELFAWWEEVKNETAA